MRTIALPAISSGAYGYPAELAAQVAVASLRNELADDASIDVTLCCYSSAMHVML